MALVTLMMTTKKALLVQLLSTTDSIDWVPGFVHYLQCIGNHFFTIHHLFSLIVMNRHQVIFLREKFKSQSCKLFIPLTSATIFHNLASIFFYSQTCSECKESSTKSLKIIFIFSKKKKKKRCSTYILKYMKQYVIHSRKYQRSKANFTIHQEPLI